MLLTSIADPRGHDQFNFRTRATFTPNSKASAERFCPLAHGLQAKVPQSAMLGNPQIEPHPVIAHPQTKLRFIVDELDLYLLPLSVRQRVTDRLSGNLIDLIAHKRR